MKQETRDRTKLLEFLFNPRSIAFVGATETVNKWGFIVLNNILAGGYEGEVYPVNPQRDRVLGLPVYPSVRQIPHPVDLAIFTVPAGKVLPSLRECAEKGVKAALVISAGFKETGDEGARMEAELVRVAREAGMIMVGPNCQGICHPSAMLYAWMPIFFFPPAGRVGLVSQSGNILNILITRIMEGRYGVSKAVSSGNEADLRAEEFIEYFAEDPETDVVLAYLEGMRDGRRFMEIARRVTARKPLVILKGGRTPSGAGAARSHTGAMAVSSELFRAACRQAGVILTHTMDDACVIASSFLYRPLPRGRRVGIVTGGGGLGVIASDLCTDMGLEVVKLSPRTLEELGKLLPSWWVPGNPVDLVAGLDMAVIKPVVEILARSGEVDAVLFLWIGSPRRKDQPEGLREGRGMDMSRVWEFMDRHLMQFAAEMVQLMKDTGIPVYIASSLDQRKGMENLYGMERSTDPLIFSSVEDACLAIGAAAEYSSYLQREGLNPGETLTAARGISA